MLCFRVRRLRWLLACDVIDHCVQLDDCGLHYLRLLVVRDARRVWQPLFQHRGEICDFGEAGSARNSGQGMHGAHELMRYFLSARLTPCRKLRVEYREMLPGFLQINLVEPAR